MNREYDVIVVGLGAIGSATVYQLGQRKQRVLGIDQYDPPHAKGSTHGETRITRQAIGEGAEYIPFALRSYELWREIEAITNQELLTITGGLIVADADAAKFHGMQDFVSYTAELAATHGIKHEVLDATGIQAVSPLLRLIGDEIAYYEPNAGILRPEKCVSIQLTLARRVGVDIHTNERVIDLDVNGKDSVTVHTDRTSYSAQQVVLSAGPWIGELLGAQYSDSFQVLRQIFYWFSAEEIAPYRAGQFPFLIWIANEQENYLSVFPVLSDADMSDVVKVCTEEYGPSTDPTTVNRVVSDVEIECFYENLVEPRIMGLMRNCPKTVVCLYTNTPDEHFVIDFHPNYPQILVTSPCSGHGFKHSAAIGETIAELICQKESSIDVTAFSFGRLFQQEGSK